MKTPPELESNLLVDSDPIPRNTAHHGAVTDFAYQQQPAAPVATSAPAAIKLPDLRTFRALSRQVFGAQAGREYIKEAIIFASMMLVAAWPLSATLNQLGTMMISPPPWVP